MAATVHTLRTDVRSGETLPACSRLTLVCLCVHFERTSGALRVPLRVHRPHSRAGVRTSRELSAFRSCVMSTS